MVVYVSEILRGFVWEKVAGGQGLPSSHINSIFKYSDLKMLPFPEYIPEYAEML